MKPIDLAKMLQRLGENSVGIHEAAVLLSIVGESTYGTISESLGLVRRTIYSRMNVLRAKGFVVTKYRPSGEVYHVRTSAGDKILKVTCGEEKK